MQWLSGFCIFTAFMLHYFHLQQSHLYSCYSTQFFLALRVPLCRLIKIRHVTCAGQVTNPSNTSISSIKLYLCHPPGGATLIFEVELLSIERRADLQCTESVGCKVRSPYFKTVHALKLTSHCCSGDYNQNCGSSPPVVYHASEMKFKGIISIGVSTVFSTILYF